MQHVIQRLSTALAMGVMLGMLLSGCDQPLSERVTGTWDFYEAEAPRKDGMSLTLEEGGTGELSSGDALAWVQYPNMTYVTITFAVGSGNMSMRLTSDTEGTLRMAGVLQELRRR